VVADQVFENKKQNLWLLNFSTFPFAGSASFVEGVREQDLVLVWVASRRAMVKSNSCAQVATSMRAL
jgi:hypothetical protein